MTVRSLTGSHLSSLFQQIAKTWKPFWGKREHFVLHPIFLTGCKILNTANKSTTFTSEQDRALRQHAAAEFKGQATRLKTAFFHSLFCSFFFHLAFDCPPPLPTPTLCACMYANACVYKNAFCFISVSSKFSSLANNDYCGRLSGCFQWDTTSSMDPVCEDATVEGMDRWLLRCGVPDWGLWDGLAGDPGSASDWSLVPVWSPSDWRGWLSRGTCWPSVSRAVDKGPGHHHVRYTERLDQWTTKHLWPAEPPPLLIQKLLNCEPWSDTYWWH